MSASLPLPAMHTIRLATLWARQWFGVTVPSRARSLLW